MNSIQNINTDTYVVTPSTTQETIVLDKSYGSDTINAIIKNYSNQPVFYVAGVGSVPTVVFPTSKTVSKVGVVVLPGAIETYTLPTNTTHIGCIQAVDGAGQNFISIGIGV